MELFKNADDYEFEEFESKLPDCVVDAIADDNFGDFMIQCTLAGVKWRKIVSFGFIEYLFNRCRCYHKCDVLLGLAKKKNEDGSKFVFDMNTLMYNIFMDTSEDQIDEPYMENFLKLFKEEYGATKEDVAKLIEETNFINKTYGTYWDEVALNGYYAENVLHVFEKVFPGDNLFPNPEGTWTDSKDGKTYDTFRFKNREFIRVPYGKMMLLRDADKPDVLPDGWRIPYIDELEAAVCEDALFMKDVQSPERISRDAESDPDHFVFAREDSEKEPLKLCAIDESNNSVEVIKDRAYRMKGSLILCRDV